MFIMVQKSSQEKVFNIFVEEPSKIHYVKEISKKINLAPTSVKNHLIRLEKQNLIHKEKGERFNGFIANRDNEGFLFYKKIANIKNLRESKLLQFLVESIYPDSIILYGSYLRGEDVESSDIDFIIFTKKGKKLNVKKFEKILKRRVHIMIEKSLDSLPNELKKEVINGSTLYGYLK